MTISEIQQVIIEDLEGLEMVEKYEYLIDLGKKLPILVENERAENNRITGCQSRTWLTILKTKTENLENKMVEKIVENKIKPNLESFDNLEKLNAKNSEPKSQITNLPINSKINSQIEIKNEQKTEEKLYFTGFSDSQIVNGLVGLLWHLFDGQNKMEIFNSELFLVEKLGFDELLTSRRVEGFWQIYHKIISMCKN